MSDAPRQRRKNSITTVAAVGTGAVLVLLLAALTGCRAIRERHAARSASASSPATPASRPHRDSRENRVQSVICLFDQKPWISADTQGDRDPEGIQFRIFLNAGGSKGVDRPGNLHIEMYRFVRGPNGAMERKLVSDWHYPTSQFARVSANLLGMGYHVNLRWANKDIAGNEVEFVTQFEDPEGNVTRGATKRLRVPKYGS